MKKNKDNGRGGFQIRSELDATNKLSLFMDIKEERAYFDEVCTRIINNPRFYLEHLDELDMFRVSWIKYKKDKDS